MSSYDAIPNPDCNSESLSAQCQSPTAPGSRRKSLLLMRSSSIDSISSTNIAVTGSSTRNLDSGSFTSTTRPSFSTLTSSRRMSPFSAMLAEKDGDVGNDEKGEPGNDEKGEQVRRQGTSSTAFICAVLRQIPAIALISIFHLMIGIPFGVSYFPMYWTSHPGDTSYSVPGGSGSSGDADFHEEGQFPIPGKEAFGIRMFLFSTLVGQVVFAFFSGFKNPIGLQMVENIGFTKELAAIAISHQGYGLEALSTVMVMFAIASILVGLVFFLLGKFQLGKVVYFFPTHVLIGLIGGIGILLCKTGLENTISDTVSITSLIEGRNLWIVVLALELVLRLLEYMTIDSKGNPRFALLSPIFFCLITPCFYTALWILKIPVSESKDAGYFFPSLSDHDESGVFLNSNFGTPWDLWKVIDFSSVSWKAILDSFPTMIALVLFSLIHVPINIPAFALSSKADADMNKELLAHGISNMLSGFGGGLQNYLAYTQSVLYDKSGGTGRVSGLAVAAVTGLLFFVGPTIASHIPRCMAGALLLHVGIDLFLEGVWDSYGKFDLLEYAGIWLIVIVMSVYGMEAAMIAGGVAAVSTYAVQNVAYLSPIRGIMPATTLRSSHWNRIAASEAILVDSDVGRSRILVVQLQGHLFFGNMAFFTDQIQGLLCPSSEESSTVDGIPTIAEQEKKPPLVLILDFTLVLGIDSSAAHGIAKLKDTILKEYSIQLCLFVTGSTEGFPTEFDLRGQLSTNNRRNSATCIPGEETSLLEKQVQHKEYQKASLHTGSRVCDSLDVALMEAEDALIARESPMLVEQDELISQWKLNARDDRLSKEEEKEEFISAFKEICPGHISEEDVNTIFSSFDREEYVKNDLIWRQNDESDCVKILILGQLIAELENEAGTTEIIPSGCSIGELGLVNGDPRMSTVKCLSKEAIIYSMSRTSFEKMISSKPRLARYIDLICVKYLALRVQHVSNRIFETRCLPI